MDLKEVQQMEINGETILGIKEACADLQKLEAQDMAQSIANCSE